MRPITPFLTIALTCLTLTAFAQDDQEKKAAKPAEVPAKASPPVFDIDFPGGTVREFVDNVNKSIERQTKSLGQVNALIPPDLATLKVPEVHFKGVDVPSLFRAIDLAMPGRGVQWIPMDKVMVLTTRPRNVETRVAFVGQLLSKFKIEDITTALQSAWGMGQENRGEAAELKYHEDTQLLIVRASKEQLNLMENVLGELGRAVAENRPIVPSRPTSSR